MWISVCVLKTNKPVAGQEALAHIQAALSGFSKISRMQMRLLLFTSRKTTHLLFTQQLPSADGDGLGQCAWCWGRIIHHCWHVSIHLK